MHEGCGKTYGGGSFGHLHVDINILENRDAMLYITACRQFSLN